jgi:hypothetical protein
MLASLRFFLRRWAWSRSRPCSEGAGSSGTRIGGAAGSSRLGAAHANARSVGSEAARALGSPMRRRSAARGGCVSWRPPAGIAPTTPATNATSSSASRSRAPTSTMAAEPISRLGVGPQDLASGRSDSKKVSNLLMSVRAAVDDAGLIEPGAITGFLGSVEWCPDPEGHSPKRSRQTASACASITSSAPGSRPLSRRHSGASTNIVGPAPVRM